MKQGEPGQGAGAVVPLTSEDLSFGLRTGRRSFWLNLSSDQEKVSEGLPKISAWK